MKSNFSVLLLSSLTILMWGFWGFFGKLALNKNMPPVSLFLAEVFISLFFAIIVVASLWGRGDVLAWRSSWSVFGILSGLGLALGLLFYYLALNKGQATVVVPLTAIYPAVATLLSYAVLGERPSVAQWIGIVLVVTGAVLLLSGPVENTPGS